MVMVYTCAEMVIIIGPTTRQVAKKESCMQF